MGKDDRVIMFLVNKTSGLGNLGTTFDQLFQYYAEHHATLTKYLKDRFGLPGRSPSDLRELILNNARKACSGNMLPADSVSLGEVMSFIQRSRSTPASQRSSSSASLRSSRGRPKKSASNATGARRQTEKKGILKDKDGKHRPH